MGYRNYIIAVDKQKFEKIRKMAKSQILKTYSLTDDISYFDIMDICNGEEVYEIGKYMDWKEELDPFLEQAFYDEEMNGLFNNDSEELYIAQPEILKAMLTHYKKVLIDYYKKLDYNDNETNEMREERISLLEQEAHTHITWLNYMDEIPENKWKINDSWLIEQEALNLAHTFKIFDKEKYTLLFVGG